MPPPVNYKKCKTCGNRNHPRSGQCAWCGAALRRPLDWFSVLGVAVIVLVLAGLGVYSCHNRAPSESKVRLPSLGTSAESGGSSSADGEPRPQKQPAP